MVENHLIKQYAVKDKVINVDGWVVYSAMQIAGLETPTSDNETMVAALKKGIFPASDADTLTPEELLALAMRVAWNLKELGNATAP